MPSSAIQAEPDQRTPWVTFPGSFIMTRNPPEWPWFSTPTSFISFEPPPPDRGSVYSASLVADDLLEDLRDALIAGDDLAARMAIHVLRAIAEVTLAKLSPIPSVH